MSRHGRECAAALTVRSARWTSPTATSSSPVRREASAPPWPGASPPTGRASSWPTWVTSSRSPRAPAGPRCAGRHLDRGRQRRADPAGRGGVRTDRPVLRQRRHRWWNRPQHDRGRLAARLRRQRQRPPLGRQAFARRVAGPRRGVLLLDGISGRTAPADRLGAVHADEAGRRRLRRVARRHVRRREACG